jgi:membrane protein implicated in regulation of membrane protease activity
VGIAVSLILIAVGAILTWGVSAHTSGVNLHVVGVILMILGVVSLLLTLLFWDSWYGRRAFRRTAYADDGYAARRPAAPRRAYRGRRRTVVEEDVAARPDDPPMP